jgi:hypothetical protein
MGKRGVYFQISPFFFSETYPQRYCGRNPAGQPASKQAREAGREGASIIQPEIYTLNLNKP